MARILVTDGDQRSALAAVRSLGRGGHAVYVGAPRTPSLAGSSRFARACAVLPEPLHSPHEFVNGIVELLQRWQIDLLLPVTEAALLAVLPERARIAAVLPFPEAAAFQRLCDKSEVAAEARALGIGVPRTVLLSSHAGLADLDVTDIGFPVVVKPHRSVTQGAAGSKAAVLPARNHAELTSALQATPQDAYPVLIQERIVGPGVGIFVLIIDGELRAAFAHRRIREKPPWGGVSVYRESIPLDEELLARSVELLRRFDFMGAGMVEYKLDVRTQRPYIMEINGRLWGSLQLAVDAGVDFPCLLVDAVLTGGTTAADRAYRSTRSRWFWGDVDNLLLRLRGLADEAGWSSSRVRACWEFLRAFGPGSRSEIFRMNDPMPALRETIEWFRALRPRSPDRAFAGR